MLEQVAPLLKDKNGQAYRRRRNQTEDEYLSRLTISCISACRFLRWLCGYMVLLQSLYQRSAMHIFNCFLCLRSALLLHSVEIASYLSWALLCRQSARILFKRLQGGLSAVSVPKGSFRSKQVGLKWVEKRAENSDGANLPSLHHPNSLLSRLRDDAS